MKECIFLELETSGLDPNSNELISLSALRLGRDCHEQFHTLLRPSRPLSDLAEKLTGLPNTVLTQAPAVADAIQEFERWRKGAPIVLCRLKFDLPFLTAAYEKAAIELRTDLIHTLEEDKVRSLLWNYLFPATIGSNLEV